MELSSTQRPYQVGRQRVRPRLFGLLALHSVLAQPVPVPPGRGQSCHQRLRIRARLLVRHVLSGILSREGQSDGPQPRIAERGRIRHGVQPSSTVVPSGIVRGSSVVRDTSPTTETSLPKVKSPFTRSALARLSEGASGTLRSKSLITL
ncbi:hypothetical protein AESSP_00487 [Aestuariimicrobium sp. T2.26MG-19.2B]|nr:hypothetical protein AESSP_00487 [Aestuariimicrobium sp. T2.26MG-19.2B]